MMRVMLAALLASFALIGAAHAQEDAETPRMAIYGDALAPGWQNWSWANVTLSYQIADAEERPMRVEAGPWEAVFLHHDPFDATEYDTLTLFIHGGARGGQSLVVMALDERGEAIADRAYRVSPTGGDWNAFNVPLADIGAADRVISGFWIQNQSPDPARRFYVNYVSLSAD